MNPDVKRYKDGLGWKTIGDLHMRKITSYEDYLSRQAEKLDGRPGWCKKLSDQLRISLGTRLSKLQIDAGLTALCLGARLGGEVMAFKDIGCFAVGIDLNPGDSNLYVLYGDFHALQFANQSTDIVYINCFDHVHEPDKILAEIHRVLKPDGRLIVESKAGSNEPKIQRMGSDRWDCLEWESVEKLAIEIQQRGFSLTKRYMARESRAAPYGFIFRKG